MSEERDDRVETAQNGDASMEEAMESMPSMDELMASYEGPELSTELREGDLVTGTVVQINDNGVMVDVGTKSEGLIPKGELEAIRDHIKLGDQIKVVVVRMDSEDVVLSKRQADVEAAWEHIVDKQDSAEILEAKVIDAVKGGLLVDLGLYGQGFVPASHVSIRRPRNLNKYIGQTLQLQVIEVERKRRRVVLSHRLVMEREREAERDVTLGKLREGQVRRGVVRRITDFGAFVDIGGVDGLLHVSELSWKRVGSPQEELRVGDPLEVMVLKLNVDEGRISLGRRQLLADPWREIPKLYREGQTVRGSVIKFVSGGTRAVVKLPVGLEVVVELPDELRPVAAPSVEEAPVAEAVEVVVEPAAAPEAVEGAEAVATEVVEPVEGAEVEAAAVEAVVEVVAEAEVAVEVEAEPEAKGLAVGSEVELRIERISLGERDLQASVAGTRAIGERGPGRLSEGERGAARGPLARGRYSDRREEEGDASNEQRAPRERRDRRRERDGDRDRESMPLEHSTTAPARRTLGDLMGDKLRSLFDSGEESSEKASGEEE
ncbi:MAG: S1 RNA-binding domain-containing protein [Armatimonadetes bacterium]|nr:S1 RNA-binding domain-containing protein [Armatimonadota bacterium]